MSSLTPAQLYAVEELIEHIADQAEVKTRQIVFPHNDPLWTDWLALFNRFEAEYSPYDMPIRCKGGCCPVHTPDETLYCEMCPNDPDAPRNGAPTHKAARTLTTPTTKEIA